MTRSPRPPKDDAIQRVVDAVHEELLGGHVVGLDPMGRTHDALEEACFREPSRWARLADAIADIMDDAPVSTRSAQAVEGLRQLATELATCEARNIRPAPSAWADLVEFAATELADQDLERDEGRHTRIAEAFRSRLRQRRRERPPMDWSWQALTRQAD